jgi:PAS domain S-box-containing protein
MFKERLKEFGIVRGFETQLRGVDGRMIRLRNTARIHRDTDGNVSYVEGVIEDVSRERLPIVSNRETARYEALYACGHVGILTLDTTGQIQDGNPALQALSGYDEVDLSSMEYVKLFEEGDQAEVLEEIRQLSEGASAIRTEKRNLRTKSGSTLTVSTLSVLVRDGSGEPNHIFIILEGG